jgi:RNA polymerase sigma-70 factor (ECF subfamily)
MDVQPDFDAPEFIARLRAGDASAWTSAIQQLGSDLLAFVKCRSYSNADDLCQTMWLKAWNSRESLVHGKLRSWLFSIARNLLIDEYRRQKKSLETVATVAIDLASDSIDEPDPRLDALKNCMNSLDERCKKLIQKFYLENTSTSELALELGIAEGTVGSGTSRCRQKLRDCIEKK